MYKRTSPPLNNIVDSRTKKAFVTNVKPVTKLIIDGPCELTVQAINDAGQVELSFLLDRKYNVDKYKLKSKDAKFRDATKPNPSTQNSTKQSLEAPRRFKQVKIDGNK